MFTSADKQSKKFSRRAFNFQGRIPPAGYGMSHPHLESASGSGSGRQWQAMAQRDSIAQGEKKKEKPGNKHLDELMA
jgi:hypothetical protein